MYNIDPSNVFLATTKNVPPLLKTDFVDQGHKCFMQDSNFPSKVTNLFRRQECCCRTYQDFDPETCPSWQNHIHQPMSKVRDGVGDSAIVFTTQRMPLP